MIQRVKTAIIATVTSMLVIVGAAGAVLTQATTAAAVDSSCKKSSIVTFPAWYENLCKDDKSIASPSDVGGIGKFVTIIVMNVVTMLLYLVGYVSLIFIIWGGFKYMISGDNSSGTAAARQTILNAVIGLILAIMAVAIVQAIAGAIK